MLMISVTNASGGSSNAVVEQLVRAVRVIVPSVFTISSTNRWHPLRQLKVPRTTGKEMVPLLTFSRSDTWDTEDSVQASHLASLFLANQ
jgi:hypothetical protein